MKAKYVLGFVFTDDFKQVVTIKKNHPDWQAGKLNGIGGKKGFNENYRVAMSREFAEEAGPEVDPCEWNLFCKIKGHDWNMQRSSLRSTVVANHCKTQTDEAVMPIWVHQVHDRGVIENCKYLIPMAINWYDSIFIANIEMLSLPE